METKFANPAPLGLSGFALTTFLLSMINVGWFSGANMPMVLACAFVFGGTAQFAAGIMEMPRGNSFGTVAFCGYGSFWWSFALFVLFLSKGVTVAFVGWYLFLWGLFTMFMWVASLKKNKALMLVFLFLTATFYLLAIGAWTGEAIINIVGGYFGLITAVLAFYLAAAESINESWGSTVLPV